MNIRKAYTSDCHALYALGITTPELRVSAQEPFMTESELLDAIKHPGSTFLLAEQNNKILGFIYARVGDLDVGIHTISAWACIVYLVVAPTYRRDGAAQALYTKCEQLLRAKGVTNLYCWANTDSVAIVPFFEKQGFVPGKTCLWMDKTIDSTDPN